MVIDEINYMKNSENNWILYFNINNGLFIEAFHFNKDKEYDGMMKLELYQKLAIYWSI